MKFQDSALAHKYLDNLKGIEIGASAHNPFNLPGRVANIDYSDDMTTIYKQAERDYCGEAEKVDAVAAADKLPYENGSLEYVLSSHVLEHMYDPIATLEEWKRVLAPGGLIFAIIPHKERTFDSNRERSTLAELVQRHVEPKPAVIPDAHHSVWITIDCVELFLHCGLEIVAVQDVDDKVGNGFTIVARKVT